MNQIQLLSLHNKMIEHKMYLKQKYTVGVINKLHKPEHNEVKEALKNTIETTLETCTIETMETNANALNVLSANLADNIILCVKKFPGVEL